MTAPRPPAKAVRPAPPTIIDLADFQESINMCIFGDPGAGKTPLAATLPNALFIATEPGTISAVRYGNAKGKVIRAYTFGEFRRAYLWLRDVAASQYEWVVVDSVTRLQEMVLRNVLDTMMVKFPHRDPDVPDKAEHQKWQIQFKKYVKSFNDLDVNVLWTAHAMRHPDAEGNETVLPQLQGKNGTDDPRTMSMWFSGTVGLNGYLGIDEDIEAAPHRRLVIKRAGDYSAFVVKDRFDLGVPYIDNPNMSEVYDMIKNGGNQAAQRRG